LKNVSEGLGPKDVFILTVLIDNPQQDIFDAMKFKKLTSTSLEEMIPFVKLFFDKIELVVRTPNSTYATFVLRK
jgi:hypothetical protein